MRVDCFVSNVLGRSYIGWLLCVGPWLVAVSSGRLIYSIVGRLLLAAVGRSL